VFAEYSATATTGGVTAPRFLPHVVVVGIEPAQRSRNAEGSTEFLVSVHEEGSALRWRRRAKVSVETQRRLVTAAEQLHLWAAGMGLTPASAGRTAEQLGRGLYRSFLGDSGARTLEALRPTALLLQVDESLVNLPWELIWGPAGPIALDCPFGRVVTTGQVPRGARDPVTEDARLRILAVANPTQDLAASEAEIDAITALAGPVGGVTVEVTVLEREAATVAAFRAAVEGQDYELLHFAGHATFDGRDPLASALLLADGTIAADELGALAWSAPPYVVFNSACSSARAGARRQLVSPRGRSNGLAAAFLSAGVEAYLGHYWPVSDSSARQFSDCFYRSLFERRNIGRALLDARCQAATAFETDRDLTALGLVYFGDSGTAARRDTVTMAT
jgi:hypothetical protein